MIVSHSYMNCFRSVVLACLATAAFVPSGTAFAQSTTTRQVVRTDAVVRGWISDLKAGGAAVETASIDWDQTSGTTRIRGLKITFAAGPAADQRRLTIAGLDLQDPRSEKGGLAAHRLVATDVQFASGPFGARLASVSADEIGLPAIDAPVADRDKPFSALVASVSGLLRISVGGARIEGAEFGFTSGTATSKVVVDKASLGGLAAGRLTRFELGRATQTTGDGTSTADLAGMAVDDLDLQSLLRLFDSRSYAPGQTRSWSPFLGSLAVESFRTGAGTDVTALSAISVRAARLRPFKSDLVPLLDLLAVDPARFATHQDEAERFGDAIGDFLQIDTLEAKALDATSGTKETARRITAGRIALAGVGPRNVDTLRLGDFGIRDANGTVTIGELSLGRVRLVPVPAAAGANNYAAIFEKLGVRRLSLTRTDANEIRIASLDVDAGEHVGLVPGRLAAKLDGFDIPVATLADPGLRDFFTGIGRDRLQISGEVSLHWQDGLDQLDFDPVTLAVDKVGRLTVSGALSGVPRALLENRMPLDKVLPQASLRRLKLVYADDGLAARALDLLATANKQQPEDLRKLLTANMPGILSTVPEAGIRNQMIFAAISFVNDPKTLEINSTIISPVPLTAIGAALAAPQTLPGLLKLDFAANRKR